MWDMEINQQPPVTNQTCNNVLFLDVVATRKVGVFV